MEPIEGSETSAFKPQTPGKYPKENILQVTNVIKLVRLEKTVVVQVPENFSKFRRTFRAYFCFNKSPDTRQLTEEM